MRRQGKRQPLFVIDRSKKSVIEAKVETQVEEEIDPTVPELKAGNGEAPLPYEVPPNSSSSKVYIPLIKNVISKKEMRWKDGYDFNTLRDSKNWDGFVLAGINLLKEKTGITSDATWVADAMAGSGDLASFLGIPYAILGDGLPYYARSAGITVENPQALYKNPLFTITDSMTMVFSGLSWGYAFLLRLIDDRIMNGAGEDDPQAVCYSPTTHVIRDTCQGWYNVGTQGSKSDSNKKMWYNLCMRGQVDLLYDWNKLHSGENIVWLITDKSQSYNEDD